MSTQRLTLLVALAAAVLCSACHRHHHHALAQAPEGRAHAAAGS